MPSVFKRSTLVGLILAITLDPVFASLNFPSHALPAVRLQSRFSEEALEFRLSSSATLWRDYSSGHRERSAILHGCSSSSFVPDPGMNAIGNGPRHRVPDASKRYWRTLAKRTQLEI